MAQSNNIITTSLPDYVQQNREVLVDQVVLRGPTIDRMAKQTGIKKSAYLNYLDVAPVFQAGAGCGFTPQGDVEMTDKTIDVSVIKVNLDVCPENLRGTFAEYLIRTRAGEQQLPYEAEIVAGIRDFIKEALEKAIWQGDKSSMDDNLAQFDGLLKLAAAAVTAGTATSVNLTGVTSAYEAIDKVILAIPPKARKKAAKINVSPALFEMYLRELVSLNLYHYSGPQNEAPMEWVHPGTDVAIVRVEGLTGSTKVLATFDRNMVYGTDMEGDMEVFSITYDEKEEQFHIKVKWASGVQFAYDSQVVLADAASVVPVAAPFNALAAIAQNTANIKDYSTVLGGIKTDADNLGGIKSDLDTIATNSANIKDYSTDIAGINTAVTGLNASDKVFKTQEQQQ